MAYQIRRLALLTSTVVKQRLLPLSPNSIRPFATFGTPVLSNEVNLEEHVAKDKVSSSSHVWWTPDPTTGVWIPEGQELCTHVSSSTNNNITTHAWFRDDVHATSAFMDH